MDPTTSALVFLGAVALIFGIEYAHCRVFFGTIASEFFIRLLRTALVFALLCLLTAIAFDQRHEVPVPAGEVTNGSILVALFFLAAHFALGYFGTRLVKRMVL